MDRIKYFKKYKIEHRKEAAIYARKWYKKHIKKWVIYRKKWYKKNKVYVSTQYKLYNIKYPEKAKARGCKWRHLNREKAAFTSKIWRQHNKEYVLLYCQTHRKQAVIAARKWQKTPRGQAYIKAQRHNRRAATKGLTLKIIQNIYETNIKTHGTLTCELCFKPIKFGQDSLDHKIPIARKKEFPKIKINSKKNLWITHCKCNNRKGSKTVLEYKAYLKKLVHMESKYKVPTKGELVCV